MSEFLFRHYVLPLSFNEPFVWVGFLDGSGVRQIPRLAVSVDRASREGSANPSFDEFLY